MKNMSYIILVIAAVAAWYFYLKSKKPHPQPAKKTVFGYCPYCGTKNAQITYYEKDGNLVITKVFCGNKSCPQTFKD